MPNFLPRGRGAQGGAESASAAFRGTKFKDEEFKDEEEVQGWEEAKDQAKQAKEKKNWTF